jgi:hypothetical protein
MNIVVCFALWAMAFALYDIAPFWMMIALGINHTLLASMTTKDNHIDTLAQAWGRFSFRKPNIIPSKHSKYTA